MILYVIVFYKYTLKKSSLLKQICACIALFLIIFGYASAEEDNEILLARLGKVQTCDPWFFGFLHTMQAAQPAGMVPTSSAACPARILCTRGVYRDTRAAKSKA